MITAGTSQSAAAGSILFLPVSGPSGAGEYYRCLAIAQTLVQRRPDLQIHFALSKEARVERLAGFHYHSLNASPTRDTDGVVTLFDKVRPKVAVFDSTFRTKQLRKAKGSGARVICLVSRRTKRRKLMTWWKLAYIDQVFVCGEGGMLCKQPGRLERLMARRWRGELDVVGPILAPGAGHRAWEDRPLKTDRHILVAPGGGGGTLHERPAALAFQDIARILAEEKSIPVRFIAGPLSDIPLSEISGVHQQRSLPPPEMINAMRCASVCILGGGSILLQGVAAGRPCVGMPAGGKDQPERIRDLARRGFIVSPRAFDAGHAAELATELLTDDSRRTALEKRIAESGITDGNGTVSQAVLTAIEAQPR